MITVSRINEEGKKEYLLDGFAFTGKREFESIGEAKDCLRSQGLTEEEIDNLKFEDSEVVE